MVSATNQLKLLAQKFDWQNKR